MSKLIKFFKQSKAMSVWRNWRQMVEDRKQNRQLIGQDRFGNKYYQYYSFHGLPTRRQVRFKNDIDFALRDLVYYQWLHHRVFDAPTDAEKQKFYLQEKERFDKAIEWDKKQQLQMLQFRRKREQLLLRDKATKQLQAEMRSNQQLRDIKTKREGDGDERLP